MHTGKLELNLTSEYQHSMLCILLHQEMERTTGIAYEAARDLADQIDGYDKAVATAKGVGQRITRARDRRMTAEAEYFEERREWLDSHEGRKRA